MLELLHGYESSAMDIKLWFFSVLLDIIMIDIGHVIFRIIVHCYSVITMKSLFKEIQVMYHKLFVYRYQLRKS